MNGCHISKSCILASLVAFAAGFGCDTASGQPRGPAEGEDGVQVLTRGPVHEAFAATVAFDPRPGVVVARAPPELIEELPPEQRPEGANVAWIPGYWGWDDERRDFLWLSGIWRALPPGRQWVPGYWAKAADGFQWTSGYWADAAASELEYLPQPPQSVEGGPNIAAPSADHVWLPGCWMWHHSRYAWRPGFWAAVQPDWDWIPAHYVWAPRGYVFVDGYWDYSVGRRGVLFAPVYFDARLYGRRGFSYSPSTVIDLAVFNDHLFWRPNYRHYYFGDYYDPVYSKAGFYASYSVYSSRYGYDPIYAHDRWRHRKDRDWERRVEANFHHRRDHEDARPPRTLAAQRQRLGSGASREKGHLMATSLSELAKRTDGPQRFQALGKQERQQIVQRRHEIEKFRSERQGLEAADPRAAGGASAKDPQGVERPKMRLPRSPIVARPGDALGKDQAPPKTHEAPRLDPKVEPRQKKAEGKRELPGDPRVKKDAPPSPLPKTEPRAKKSDAPRQLPKAEPRVKKSDPRSEQPKAEPRVKKSDSQPLQPKAEPRVKKNDPPRQPPQAEPRAKKSDSRPLQPRAEPRVKKDAPQPQQPKAQPRVQKSEPRPQPKAEPRAKKSDPQPPPSKAEPKQPPRGKSKEDR